MQTIEIRQWCDFCYADGEQLTPAAVTFTLGLVEGETRPVLRVLQACEPHSKPVHELRELGLKLGKLDEANKLASAGRPPSKIPADPDRPTRGPDTAPTQCPLCQIETTTRSALVTHIWSTHRRGEPRPQIPRVCPECGKDYPSSNMASHRKTHGVDAVEVALAGARP